MTVGNMQKKVKALAVEFKLWGLQNIFFLLHAESDFLKRSIWIFMNKLFLGNKNPYFETFFSARFSFYKKTIFLPEPKFS